MSGYDVRFPGQIHEDRFYSVLKDNADAKAIFGAVERLRVDPRPKDLHFDQIPPVDEAQFLITKFGIAL